MQFSNEDIKSEGFMPLRRAPTEPKLLPSKPELVRGMSFNQETGEKESQQILWDSSRHKNSATASMMNRANSFVGHTPSKDRGSSTMANKDGAVVIVDPFSTGAHLAVSVVKAGYKCVCVFSIWDSPVASLVQEGVVAEFAATLQHDDRAIDQDSAINATVRAIKELPFPIIAVIPGAETGVELADSLSARLKLRSNGEAGSFARRNKYAMGEAVRNAGHRAVKQQNCTDLPMLYTFLDTLPKHPFKCVLKPVQSAGSDDVFLCNNYDEAVVAFHRIVGKRNGLGLINKGVLAQEYLRGKEYVVDHVSKNGVHKIVQIWQYDKRLINGAAFVYFGMKLCSCEGALSQELIVYAEKVLDALGIMEGPSHMEVMYNSDLTLEEGGGPCLVEVGSRCHGGEGSWLPLSRACIGYTQVDVVTDVYLNGPMFDTLAARHYPCSKYAMDCDMVGRVGGIVRAIPGDQLVRNFASFYSISWEVKVGEYSALTIDCFTRPGVVQLLNADEAQMMRDFDAYHQLEEEGKFIDYSIICPKAPTVGSIVVVDPFSAGTHLAALALKWGFKLILVFTQQADDGGAASKTLLSQQGQHYKPTLMIQHKNLSLGAAEAVEATLKVLRKQGESSPILAIIPGADTGVAVAEALASRFGTRSNGNNITGLADKETIQRAVQGVSTAFKTIPQKLCTSERDVEHFFAAGGNKPVVIKPRDGSGEAAVMLCQTVEEAVYAFKSIHEQANIFGVPHHGAMIQEYITGTEYVVDGVSRNDNYKVLAVWECEKRSFNGSDFVPFSMKLNPCSGSDHRIAITEFVKSIVPSVGIHNGPSSVKVVYSDHYNCPLLVEVNANCHSQDGAWVTVVNECIGYSQVEATMSCYVRADRFDEIPNEVHSLKAHGMEVYLVSSGRGVVKDIIGLESIRNLASCKRIDMYTQPGAHVIPTSDYQSRVGTVVLVNTDVHQLEADYQAIRQLELNQKLIRFV